MFENFVELVSDTLQKHYNVWLFDKNKLAVGVILFARSIFLSGNSTWSSRLEDISLLLPKDVKECFTSICQFFSQQKSTTNCSPQKVSERVLKPNLQPTSMTSINNLPSCSSNSDGSQKTIDNESSHRGSIFEIPNKSLKKRGSGEAVACEYEPPCKSRFYQDSTTSSYGSSSKKTRASFTSIGD